MSFIVDSLGQLFVALIDFTNNYGIAIIILTVLFRLITLPLTLKQMKSTQAMNEIAPERKKIEEKYKNDKEKQSKALMELYKEKKINPLAGCLPMLIQLPIFIAMFRVFQDPEIIVHVFENVSTKFLGIDLAAGVSLAEAEIVAPEGWNDVAARAEHARTLYILPILAGATTYLQTKVTMAGNAASSQQGGMAAMTTIMPIMIIFFSVSLPPALALYWFAGNVFAIGQHLVLQKSKLSSKTAEGE
ncbi:YidC/Oxa1 family membrane protein insertase [Proteinivorax hydrogeniformans]|uniref:YidC/Oxa1 family membrane protein insertase n=1 Tax=Proteinivorax hydrogeniformans TaxID=1826727 RepID=A0AAU8HTV3_9FIRM